MEFSKKNINNKSSHIFYDDDIKSFLERVSKTGYDIVPIQNYSVDELYNKLIDSVKYLDKNEKIIIKKAFEFSKKHHENMFRKSGEPYIIHPLWVAIILADLELDCESIIAGLLHDTIEDTSATYEDIKNEFSPEVAELVEGVTKLGRLNYATGKIDEQGENLRKMFLAMAKDIRVILIKLADRLHNMRTLQYMSKEKQIEKSKETIDIYSPIAQRLGITKIRIELDDLALLYSNPKEYINILNKVNDRQIGRENFINQIVDDVKKHIKMANIQAEIYGRVKHLFSIYRKMINQGKDVDEIYDLFAVRILVNSVKDCYGALGVIHDMYIPIPGKFKDYIAMPKSNMYQSLHTTVIGPSGQPFEVQIRTYEMHKVAEFGIAAHWKYKEAGYSAKNEEDKEEAKLTWLRQVLEWQQDMSDNKEFMSLLKRDLDLFSDHVYCFTPEGDVKTFPKGSSTIDFAYSIHSAIGNKMIGARVNDKLVPIDYILKNGDRVSIITSQNSNGPSRDWLKIAKSAQARNKINQWFKQIDKDENLLKGKELLTNSIKQKGYEPQEILKDKFQNIIKSKYSYKSWDGILATIGRGGLKEGLIANRLIEEYEKTTKKEISDLDIINEYSNKNSFESKSNKGEVIVKGSSDIDVHFARCCNPMPGDEIVGFVTRGRGITVHRTDCMNIVSLSTNDKQRIMPASWQNTNLTNENTYYTSINIYSKTKKGIIMEITKIFVEEKIDILSINARSNKNDTTTIEVGFELAGKEVLEKLFNKIKMLNNVIDVVRKNG